MLISLAGLFFHVVGEGVVNLSKKAENFTDKENYIDFRLRLLGEPGKTHFRGLLWLLFALFGEEIGFCESQ